MNGDHRSATHLESFRRPSHFATAANDFAAASYDEGKTATQTGKNGRKYAKSLHDFAYFLLFSPVSSHFSATRNATRHLPPPFIAIQTP
jgi:hypothetical protein